MKARLLPLKFKTVPMAELEQQLTHLRALLNDTAEFLPAVEIGNPLPAADAVVLPVLVGEAYSRVAEFRSITIPIIALTSEFGTVAMWDWEIVTFLRSEGIVIYSPYNISIAKTFCRTLLVKKELPNTKFLVYQDNPGDGMQAEIFKRFYWWEEECTQLIKQRFGITIEKKSFRTLGQEAKALPDKAAEEVIDTWRMKDIDLSHRAYLGAIKLYLAVKKDIDADPSIKGSGINCLNESFHSDSTPCLAWSMLYEEKGLIWGCEADTMSLLTMFLANKCLDAPVMMTNLYPFLTGMTALKHERISAFPDVPEPENCILVGHCGFLGVIPRCMTDTWSIKPKVLRIVDENAHAIDARLPIGPVTLVKLHPKLDTLQVIGGKLEDYVHYPGSDCRNGGVIRVKNGYQLMNRLYSHHYTIVPGVKHAEIETMNQLLGLNSETI